VCGEKVSRLSGPPGRSKVQTSALPLSRMLIATIVPSGEMRDAP